jgi:hypothetical protein
LKIGLLTLEQRLPRRMEKRNHSSLHHATLGGKTYPGKVRGTADPSASLGMTKGKGDLSMEGGFSTGGVMGLRPTQGDEKRHRSSNLAIRSLTPKGLLSGALVSWTSF